MTMAELSKKYGVHPTQIGTWKRAAIENMSSAFTRGGSILEQVSIADVDKLHSVNWQVIACNHWEERVRRPERCQPNTAERRCKPDEQQSEKNPWMENTR
jgi:hypothetical protein